MLGIVLTPAWLAPPWLARPWLVLSLLLAGPAVILTWHHAPWVPTPAAEMPRILAALDLAPTDRFCDLGAGDGRLVLRVRRATGADCTGIEATPLLAMVGWLRVLWWGDARTTIWWGNLYAADLSAFDVVYVWGTAYSVGTDRFRRQVTERMRPGARLVSYHTRIPGLAPSQVDEDGKRPLYVYVIGDGRTPPETRG